MSGLGPYFITENIRVVSAMLKTAIKVITKIDPNVSSHQPLHPWQILTQ